MNVSTRIRWGIAAFAATGLSLVVVPSVAGAQGTAAPDACALLPAADVSAAFGATFEPFSAPENHECNYVHGQQADIVNLRVDTLTSAESKTVIKNLSGKGCKSKKGVVVKGVGAAACFFPSGSTPPNVQTISKPAKGKSAAEFGLSLMQLDPDGGPIPVTFVSADQARAQLPKLAKQALAQFQAAG